MFLNALTDTAQFGIQALIVTVSIVIVLIVIGNILMRLKGQQKKDITVKDLNDKLLAMKKTLQDAVLSEKAIKQQAKSEKKGKKKKAADMESRPRLWLIDFEGDIKATSAEHLRTEITSVLQVANEKDEVVVRVESPGGVVHGYGLAASQLARVRQKNIPLTICVDKVAASGGYMMACVGQKIIAAPFAIVGSIGVLAQVPNLHRLLNKNNVDYNEFTAGEYKRTISFLAENTEAGIQKFKEQLEETHVLFKGWVSENRPNMDIGKVATGEYWYGRQALDLGLIDHIQTSDDYLMERAETHRIIQVSTPTKKTFSEKLSDAMGYAAAQAGERAVETLIGQNPIDRIR